MKTLAVALPLFLLGISFAIGQDHPAAEQRWQNQHHLMKTGRASGRTSKPDALRLRREYRQVTKAEKRMKQNSWLTSRRFNNKHDMPVRERAKGARKNAYSSKRDRIEGYTKG